MKYRYHHRFAIAKWLGLLILVLGIVLGLRYILWRTHVHPVIPGVIYRSGQVSSSHFEQAIQDYHIRSILNLRGANPGQGWYDQEIKISGENQVQHYDLSLHAEKMPSKSQLQSLAKILLTSPKPLLVHCEGGADRTGLALATFYILQNQPISEAEKLYSFRYYVMRKDSVGKLVIPLYVKWLRENKFTSSRENFLKWLSQ